jgi:hypothetical protein
VDHTVIVNFLYRLTSLFEAMNTKILLSGFAIIVALGLVVAATSAFAQNMTGGNMTGGNMTGGNMTGDNATTATADDAEEDNGDDGDDGDDDGEGGGN